MKNQYQFTKPTKTLVNAQRDNIAIVPASQLPFKNVWQQITNNLPHGSVLLYGFPNNKPYQKILTRVRELFEQKGHRVTILVNE